MKVATFNVNGVRARLPVVISFLESEQADVLCLQETKVVDEDFPREPFEALGYECAISGQKSYNGVAILSRLPMKGVRVGFDEGEPADETRLIWGKVGPMIIVNTYVPQGRDIESEHYRYKLEWLARLREFFERNFTPRRRVLWVGDINVAPEPRDVHDPKGLRDHPDFHIDAREALARVVEWGLVDLLRMHNDEDGQFSYYDYRAPNALARNVGWRVDHLFATRSLANRCVSARIDLGPRAMERPSDHTPVIAEFDL
jgi:exodeoxyribonuclease-3